MQREDLPTMPAVDLSKIIAFDKNQYFNHLDHEIHRGDKHHKFNYEVKKCLTSLRNDFIHGFHDSAPKIEKVRYEPDHLDTKTFLREYQ